MPIWLYCQSCQQWSKSDASLSNDKTCPLCSNLYISMKPVIDSNPYKIKADNIEQQGDPRLVEADIQTAAEDADEGADSAEPGGNENELPEEPGKTENSQEKRAEFDYVEILDKTATAGTTLKTGSEDNDKETAAEEELSPAVPDAVRGEDCQLPTTGQETEKNADKHAIPVLGKESDPPDGEQTGETDDKTQADISGDSSSKKRRLRPR